MLVILAHDRLTQEQLRLLLLLLGVQFVFFCKLLLLFNQANLATSSPSSHVSTSSMDTRVVDSRMELISVLELFILLG